MTAPNKIQVLALCLIMFLTAFAITLTKATTENNYKNDTNLLPRISEGTHAENGYKANIIINPYTTGIIAKENGFTLDLTINPQGVGGALTESNYQLDLIPEKTFPDSADVAVTEIATSKTIVGQGYSVLINVTLSNQAFNYETFYFFNNANTTVINAETITLTSRKSETITFTWNTTGFAKGNYTISAYAWPVPGETYTADNTLAGGHITVTIPGDIKGDFVVDIYDAIILANAYNSKLGGKYWNPNADINGDNIVDIYDAIILANHYNQHYP